MAGKLPFRLRTVAAAVTVVASGLIIMTSYQAIINSSDEAPHALPIIHASDEPFRVMPEDPGGMEILNKDSTLFDVMDEERSDPLALDGVTMEAEQAEPETLYADNIDEPRAGFSIPEAPEERTESLYGVIEDLKDRPSAEVVENVEVNDAPVAELDETPSEDVVETTETVPLTQDDKEELKQKLQSVIAKAQEDEAKVQEEKQVEAMMDILPLPKLKPSVPAKQAVAKAEEKPVAVTTTPEKFSLEQVLATPVKERYYIQLASLRDEAAARDAYDRIKADFPALVAGASVVFPKADLGARGTFTRIQVGPFEQAEAQRRCANYTASARGGTCLVISR